MKKVLILSMMAIAGGAFAASFDITGGTGGAIVDNADLIFSMNVATSGTITSLQLAGLNGMTHTWLGDLSVTISHNGKNIDLMDRNYRTTATGLGLSSDMNGNYMFDEGASLMSGTTIAAGTYGRFANAGFGSSAAADNYASLNGTELSGTWTITIHDYESGDTGAVQSMRIVGTYNAVPEPATMAALGLGLAALARRRRK